MLPPRTSWPRVIESPAGPKTAAQVVDDWTSVLCRADALAPLLAEHAPGAFRVEELAAVAAWSRARHEELMAFLAERVAK